MNKFARGISSGFVATLVLSILMIGKTKMGLVPGLDVIPMLAKLDHHFLGLPATPLVGWISHFLIGTLLWGLLFAWFYDRLPSGSAVGKAVAFGIGAWLAMMILLMPLAGAGLFGLNIGLAVPVAILVLHLIWAVVLGLVFAGLGPRSTDHQAAR